MCCFEGEEGGLTWSVWIWSGARAVPVGVEFVEFEKDGCQCSRFRWQVVVR